MSFLFWFTRHAVASSSLGVGEIFRNQELFAPKGPGQPQLVNLIKQMFIFQNTNCPHGPKWEPHLLALRAPKKKNVLQYKSKEYDFKTLFFKSIKFWPSTHTPPVESAWSIAHPGFSYDSDAKGTFFGPESRNSSAHQHGLCAHYIPPFRIAWECSEHLPRFVLRQNSERVLDSWGVYGTKFFWMPWPSEGFIIAHNPLPEPPICSDQHCWLNA